MFDSIFNVYICVDQTRIQTRTCLTFIEILELLQLSLGTGIGIW